MHKVNLVKSPIVTTFCLCLIPYDTHDFRFRFSPLRTDQIRGRLEEIIAAEKYVYACDHEYATRTAQIAWFIFN